MDRQVLLLQLAQIRELALKVPFTNESYPPTNTVVDAIWRLEERFRYLCTCTATDSARSPAKAIRSRRRPVEPFRALRLRKSPQPLHALADTGDVPESENQETLVARAFPSRSRGTYGKSRRRS